MNRYEEHRRTLACKRTAAIAEAERLLEQDRFEDAERFIKDIEPSLEGDVAVKQLYRRRLERLVASIGVTPVNRQRLENVFRRAVEWANVAYPEPWTKIERDNYDAGRRDDRAELVRILTYDPDLT